MTITIQCKSYRILGRRSAMARERRRAAFLQPWRLIKVDLELYHRLEYRHYLPLDRRARGSRKARIAKVVERCMPIGI